MNEKFQKLGFYPADILLPKDADMTKWAVVACDQFTSQPEYWQAVEDTVGDAPSALRLILPEAKLNDPDVDKDIADINSAMNRYLNGMLTNEEVIQELLKLAKEISNAHAEGEKLGLTAEELAFYDAITKPQAIKDFYERDELIAITKELTDLLRQNRTIDWQKKESARAGMRRLVKRLLKKHKYPPEGMEDAVQTVMSQCEMWTDAMET